MYDLSNLQNFLHFHSLQTVDIGIAFVAHPAIKKDKQTKSIGIVDNEKYRVYSGTQWIETMFFRNKCVDYT